MDGKVLSRYLLKAGTPAATEAHEFNGRSTGLRRLSLLTGPLYKIYHVESYLLACM